MKKLFLKIFRYLDFRRRGIKVWGPCNIYLSAKIGDNVSIGMFSEIGHNVEIGENTRIGFGCFIPEGVTIGKNCFIGPRVTFSNDMYPPAPTKWLWQRTVVQDNVSLGAGVCVRPGVTICEGSLIGMGAIVCHDIPSDMVVTGRPAIPIRKKGENLCQEQST